MKRLKLGLLPRVAIAIGLGVVCGLFFPGWLVRIFITINSLFGNFLNFIIPFLFLCFPQRGRIFRRSVPAFSRICESFFVFSIFASCSMKSHTLSRQSVFGINTLDFI